MTLKINVQIPQVVAPFKEDVPHIAEYFGPWSILEEQFRPAVESLSLLQLQAHIATAKSGDAPRIRSEYAIRDGVAIIGMQGTMMKFTSSMDDGASTVAIRRQINAAAANDEVQAILLAIDSPGGTVAGTMDLAASVAKAREKKPVHAYIEDLGASAAYWVASQATRIIANNATARIGSIGTYAVIYDQQARAALMGLKVHVVKSGTHKGDGVPGTEITAVQLAEWQRMVDGLNEHFLQGVAAGRKLALSRVRELADGRVHLAAEAQLLGLIDGVQSFDQTLSQIKDTFSKSSKERKTMSQSTETAELAVATLKSSQASLDDLRSACPGATNDFLIAQMDRKATVEQSRDAYIKQLQIDRDAAKADAAKAKTDADAVAKKAADDAAALAAKPGVKALASSGKTTTEATSDPIAAFNEAVAELVKQGQPKAKAIRNAAVKDPDLHGNYLAAVNEQARTLRRA